MKRLIYFKNGQSLDLLVSLLTLSSHDFVDHVAHDFKTKKKKKEYKDDIFKNNIDSVAFLYTRDRKKPFKVLSFV